MILSQPVLRAIRRELRKFAEGIKVDLGDVETILKTEVLKRELVEGEDAETAQARVNRFYKKATPRQKKEKAAPASPREEDVSFSDSLLRESGENPESSIQQ